MLGSAMAMGNGSKELSEVWMEKRPLVVARTKFLIVGKAFQPDGGREGVKFVQICQKNKIRFSHHSLALVTQSVA